MHKALYFAFGVAVGAGASWYFWKEYHRKRADEEIQSVKDAFASKKVEEGKYEKKEVQMTVDMGTYEKERQSKLQDYPIDIIGMNHDNYIDSSGKAPLTFQLHPCYDHAYKIFTTVPTSASWKDSDMRQINLPAIMALMPEEVQTAIRVVEKNTPSSGLTNDKLFALSKAEFTGDTTSSYGTQYAYYAAGNTPAKTRRTSTTKRRHWTRDTDPDNAVNFLYIDTTGAIASNKVTTSNMYVAFAFCF